MQPKIVTIEEKKVVGMSANFISSLSPEKNNHVVIPQLWGQYMQRAHEIKSRKSWACDVQLHDLL